MVQPPVALINLQIKTIFERNRYTGYPTKQVSKALVTFDFNGPGALTFMPESLAWLAQLSLSLSMHSHLKHALDM